MRGRIRQLVLIGTFGVLLLGSAQAAQAALLTYMNGPVVHSVTGTVVDWGPSVSSTYTSETAGDPALVKYFATQNGTGGDIGGVLAQYMDNTGHNSANHVAYGGQFEITPSVTSTTITDAQIQAELKAQIAAGHLPTPPGDGLSTIYMVLFPHADTICMSAGQCSNNVFCAYHNSLTLPSSTHVLYAVLPDESTTGGCGSSSVDLNNQTSFTSHEWSETINDPLVGENNLAWYDNTNGEIGDICNAQQSTNGPWTVQKEWSNKDGACVSSEPSYSQPSAVFVSPSAVAGQAVGFDGTSSSDPAANHTAIPSTVFAISSGLATYDWSWGDGTPDGSGPAPTHTYAAGGNYQVTLTLTDNMGFIGTVTHPITVNNPPPAVTTGAVDGISHQGATLHGTLNPYDQVVSYQFVYGTSPASLSSGTPVTAGPAGHVATPVSATISGLSASTTYYYRLDATLGAQTIPGAVHSFSTNGAPPPPQTPVAGTGSATQITTSGGHLDGTINPGGPAAVAFHFSYGRAPGSLGLTTPETAGPSGTTASTVGANVALSAHTTYYFRLDVDLGGQTHSGAVRSFTTLAPAPGVSTGAASNVADISATAGGTVDPHGFATTYHVEFGETSSYGHSSAPASAGAGGSAQAVTAALTGLSARTVYHYRVVAQSVGGTVAGTDRTFKTSPPLRPAPGLALSIGSSPKIGNALAKGLSVGFFCSKACTVNVVATALLAGITHVVASPLILARGSATLRGKGRGHVVLQFTSSAKSRLRKARAVKLVISGVAGGRGVRTSVPKLTSLTLKR